MLIHIDKKEHGLLDHDWIKSYHHFSFGDFYDESKRNFGVIRALNENVVKPGKGHPFHPHYDMEIFTYMLSGQLEHTDSVGHTQTLEAGDIQLLSSGIGVFHSEMNKAKKNAHFIQIWMSPMQIGAVPRYQYFKTVTENRKDKWDRIASHENGPSGLGPIIVNQDVNIYVIESDQKFDFAVIPGRKVYVACLEDDVNVNHKITMKKKDALMAFDEHLRFEPEGHAHMLLIEMAG